MIPSEKAGIKVEGLNKWITIIQNTSKKSIIKKNPKLNYIKFKNKIMIG